MNIVIGKIVNTFGIKGELKIVSNFEMASRAFKKGNKIIINNKERLITNSRFHHHNYLVEIDNIKDINEVTYLIGAKVSINKDELKLKENEYLMCELNGYTLYNGDKCIGNVDEVVINEINPLIKVNGHFIPLQKNFIKKVDVNNKKIICQNIDELVKEG